MFDETKKAAKNKITPEASKASFDAQKPLGVQNDLPGENGSEESKEVAVIKPEELMPSDLENENVVDGVFAMLKEKSEAGTLQEMTADYLDFNSFADGAKIPFIFTRMTDYKNPETEEMQPAVCLMDENGKTWISAATVLVRSLEKLDKIPCGIIVLKEAKKSGKKYHNLRVFVL